jgi:hypothetical protein
VRSLSSGETTSSAGSSIRYMRKPTLIECVGILALATFIAALVINLSSDRLDAWAPNAGTEAISVFVTVVVVGAILRREEKRRRGPRVDRALEHIGFELTRLTAATATDYAVTHAAHYRPIPVDALALLDQWLEDQEASDMPRAAGALWYGMEDLGSFFDIACEFAAQVEQYDQRDRDVLEPELVAAIRDLWSTHRRALKVMNTNPANRIPLLDYDRQAHRTIVFGARVFGEVLRRHARKQFFVVGEETIKDANEARAARMRVLGLSAT